MSNELWASLFSALSAIITAAIAAYMQVRIAGLNADVEREKMRAGEKSRKVKEPEKGEQIKKNHTADAAKALPKPKLNWVRIGLMAILFGAVAFAIVFVLVTAIRTLLFKPTEPTASPISLANANVEFQVTIGGNTQTVSAYGTLILQKGTRIRIETSVTDATGAPYPHDLEFKYFFASGRSFTGKVTPYTASQAALIPVEIRDRVTGETITRTLRINMD